MAEIKTPKTFSHLTSITTIDGRFRGKTEELSQYFSEYATIKGRVFVEIEYLIALLKKLKNPLSASDKSKLRNVHKNFSEKDALWIWNKDEQINHDTKAAEYFLANKLKKLRLSKFTNYLHLGITSTDIDNTALALSLNSFLKKTYIPQIQSLVKVLTKLSKDQKNVVMLARTHAKPAVPTIAGKEIANYLHRVQVQLKKLQSIKIGSKVTGAVGNHNALHAAYPNINWFAFSNKFLNSLGLESYQMTTQVEAYDHKVELIQIIKRINLIIISFNQAIWFHIGLGYISLRDKKGHVGSSTMPQKINPIGFEMSESYLKLANGIFEVLENNLPLNRLQRDLTDKYLLRDLGQALVMATIAYESTTNALSQIGFNKGVLEKDLENHWESIAEGLQTILRTTNIKNPYEKLKKLTRGKSVTQKDYLEFIDKLEVSKETKTKLKKLSPHTYTGLAPKPSK